MSIKILSTTITPPSGLMDRTWKTIWKKWTSSKPEGLWWW